MTAICIKQGLDTGLSQIAQRAGGQDTAVVWNFPIDVTFKATNAFGWPRVALSVSIERTLTAGQQYCLEIYRSCTVADSSDGVVVPSA